MADVGNIRPVNPVTPRKPTERVKPGRRRSDNDQRPKPAPQRDEHEDDDGDEHHIDEYA